MNRRVFMDALSYGLRGATPSAKADILSDYDSHFDAGLAAGRSESEIATALGDPHRLARELRAQAGMKRWEEERSPSSAANMVLALLGLGIIDFLILLPLVLPALIFLIIWFLVIVVSFFAGLFCVIATLTGQLEQFAASPAQGVLIGLGMMAGGVSGAALEILVVMGLVHALIWFARLHIKVLQPEPKA